MRKTSHGIGKDCWMIGDKKLYEVVTTQLHAHLKDKPFRLREKVFSRKKSQSLIICLENDINT